MECVESVKSQDYSVSHQWARQSTLSLAVWGVDGFRQHFLLRFDLHPVGFLYIECLLNPLPRKFWQRLLLSTDRPLLNRSGKKKPLVHPQFRAHVEGKLFQHCRLSTSLNAGVREIPLHPVISTCLHLDTVCVQFCIFSHISES